MLFEGLVILGLLTTTLAQAGVSPSVSDAYQHLRSEVFEKSVDLGIARAQASQRKAQVYTSATKWLPRAELQLSQSRNLDYSLVTSGALGNSSLFQFTPEETPLSKWALNVTFPIYRRSVHLGLQQSLDEKAVADEQVTAKSTELDWKLRSYVGNYFLQIYKVVTLKNSIEIAKTNLREATLRFELGQKTKIDVLRSQANLISLESRALSDQEQRDKSLSDLLAYSGLTLDQFLHSEIAEVAKDESKIGDAIDQFSKADLELEKIKPFLDSAKRTEVESRVAVASPTYRGYLAQESLENSQARSLMAQEFPDLSFQASVSEQGQHWSDTTKPGFESHYFALILTVPIFSGGSTFSTYAEKQNAQDASRLRTQKQIEDFKTEVLNEITRIGALLKTSDAQKLSADQNEEIVRLSTKSYQLGKTTIVELLGSENDLIDAKINLAKTKLDLSTLVRQFAWNLGVNAE